MALPFEIPPSKFVRETAELFDPATPSRILDVGSGEGRNSLYMAKLGHEVLGITNEYVEALIATEAARNAGLEACRFVVGDVRKLPIRKPFDVVLVNELLHQMPKTHARSVLQEVQHLTRQGGLNVISGYVVDPGRASTLNRERCFSPSELEQLYVRDGWEIVSYEEDAFAAQHVGNREFVHSLARIVAQRRWTKRS